MVERANAMNAPADDPRAIQARIERTRMEMTETVDEIQERLAPDRLKREAQQKVREATIGKMEEMTNMAKHKAKNLRSEVVNTIKSNPVPAALTGLGIGWLIMSGSKEDHQSVREYDYTRSYAGRRYTPTYRDEWAPRAYGYTGVEQETDIGQRIGDTTEDLRWQAEQKIDDVRWQAEQKFDDVRGQAQQKADQVRGQVEQTTDEVRMRAGQMADQARARAEELGDDAQQMVDDAEQQLETWGREARQQAQHASRSMQELMKENPLAVGAMALAIGAAIGLSLPSTETEDELMGDTRDRVMSEAKSSAGEAMDKVRNVAEEAKESAEQAVQKVEQSAKQGATNVKETVKSEAQKQNMTSGNATSVKETPKPEAQKETQKQTVTSGSSSDKSKSSNA